jgi:hypothetical protein
MADTIQHAIEESAKTGIASASVDGNSVTAMSIDDQIKADHYTGAKVAAAKNHMGFYFFKIEAPGAG